MTATCWGLRIGELEDQDAQDARAEFIETHCICLDDDPALAPELSWHPACPIRGHGDPELIGAGW
jgi:hypothetical protein